MSNKIIVHKGRTNIIVVDLGADISTEEYTSQIRSEPDQDAPLIAEWDVSFATDGTDGKLNLVLAEVVTGQISALSGFMDLKRNIGFYTVAVFDKPLEVEFRGTVTA